MSSPQRKSDEGGDQDVYDFAEEDDNDGLVSEEGKGTILNFLRGWYYEIIRKVVA